MHTSQNDVASANNEGVIDLINVRLLVAVLSEGLYCDY